MRAQAAKEPMLMRVAKLCRRTAGHNRRVAIACYSQGSAERLPGFCARHGFRALQSAGQKLGRIAQMRCETGRARHPGLRAWFYFARSRADHGAGYSRRPSGAARAQTPRLKPFQLELGTLNPGDFVVHAEHGIGRYEGLETVTVFNTAHDCVKLIYDGGDKLFVPVENLDMLTRYGYRRNPARRSINLAARAGSSARRASRNASRIWPKSLMKIAAARELRKGEIDRRARRRLCRNSPRVFPIPKPKIRPKPSKACWMILPAANRWIGWCAAMSVSAKPKLRCAPPLPPCRRGCRSRWWCRRRLLARQHFNNFTQRFAGFPVRIAQLSRMVPVSEAKQTKEDLKAGRVDIVDRHACAAGQG